MDNKVIAIGAVVVVAILAVAAFAVIGNGGSDDSNYVVYDGNGGKTSDGETTIKSTETVAASLNLFTRAGYECTGWNTKADGTGTSYGPNANVMHGVKLYAQWKPVVVGGELEVQTKNLYSDKFNFTLEPSGQTIDNFGQYTLSEGSKICITPTSTAVIGVTGTTITITFADGTVYTIVPSMGNEGTIKNVYTDGTSAYIEFEYSKSVNPTFSYIVSETKP